MLENSSSCIDLIFTSQPDLSAELETHSSLPFNCHYQNIYEKFMKSFTHHITLAMFGTIKIQMLTLSDDPLMNLTRINPLQINM